MDNKTSTKIQYRLFSIRIILFLSLSIIPLIGTSQNDFKGIYTNLSSGVKYVSAPELNKEIEYWLILNGFLPRMSSKDAINWGISSDFTFLFPVFKIVDISIDVNHTYFKKEYLNDYNDCLIVSANQITPSVNAYFRLGPLRLGGGCFYSFYTNNWNDKINSTQIKFKNNHFGYSVNSVLITPVIKRISIISKAKYEVIKYKIDNNNYSFSGLSFNIGIGIKL